MNVSRAAEGQSHRDWPRGHGQTLNGWHLLQTGFRLFYRSPAAGNTRYWRAMDLWLKILPLSVWRQTNGRIRVSGKPPKRVENQINLTFPETLFEVLIKFRMEPFY